MAQIQVKKNVTLDGDELREAVFLYCKKKKYLSKDAKQDEVLIAFKNGDELAQLTGVSVEG